MNSNSGKEEHIPRNADVQEEFIKIIRGPKLNSYWKGYIRSRLNQSIIGKYGERCNEDDIMSKLTMKIYDREIVWNRDVYKEFKDFMYGKIHNIMRNMERGLKRRFEFLNNDEKEEKLYIAEPKSGPKFIENFVELNTDSIGKELIDKKDKFAYYKNTFESQFDPEKFNETVLVILKHPDDTELLAVYTGYIKKKKRRDVMEEYGLTLQEYEKIWKRLLYKLKHELPPNYRNMLSTTMIAHLIMHQIMY